jgi:hypothetical protein
MSQQVGKFFMGGIKASDNFLGIPTVMAMGESGLEVGLTMIAPLYMVGHVMCKKSKF